MNCSNAYVGRSFFLGKHFFHCVPITINKAKFENVIISYFVIVGLLEIKSFFLEVLHNILHSSLVGCRKSMLCLLNNFLFKMKKLFWHSLMISKN
jgi:hypothetical protein